MPQSAKKRPTDKDSVVVSQCEDSNGSSVAGSTNALNHSNSSNTSAKSRKRKRCDVVRFSDLESEFEDCDLEDAAALETKLRKVARRNSLTHDEMMKLLHKFVKNEHILALVTLKAEDALAKEQQENEEQRAIIITETPSVPKLTRAKARELNKTPIIQLPSLKDQDTEPEIAALIKDDLHSDEEDEEYVFKEEDFVSDDDPNTTASDIESNPRTPQTPASQFEDSPVKLSDDGCFKVPLSKKSQELSEELRIAARTRSKLCLEQTTIEDLQSEFVPPDVEEPLETTDLQPLDEDWMQFLNDFSKPLNASLVADDDDPINDPEYVAAEKEPDYRDDEQSDTSQLNDSLGVLTTIKTPDGGNISVYLRLGNRILFCSGKYFYIEHTTAQTDHQKEYTGIVSTCHTCGVKIKGSLKVSSNFICHLKARHPEVYQEFLKQKQESGTGNRFKKSEKFHGSHRTSPYPANTPIIGSVLQQQETLEQFQRNVLQFLIATNQSLSLVEDPNFLKLFEFMDFPVQLKTPKYYDQIIKDDCKYKQLELANFFNNNGIYVCLTSDSWSYGECKYLALACHWIDEQYQRQTSLLACIRSHKEDGKSLQTLQNDVWLRYGFQKDCIVNIITENIRNYATDFVEFGINKDVLCMDSCDLKEDCTLLKEMQKKLNLLNPNNEAEMNVIQLDILRLSKIWSIGFIVQLDEDTNHLHRSCMGKCSMIWQESQGKHFKDHFEKILNGPLTPPNLFSLTSLYNSLKQVLQNKNQLADICCFLKKPNFTSSELEYLEELVDIFEPLHAAFEFLDMPQNHFYGCFLPTLVTLKWKLTRLFNSNKLKYLQGLLVKLKQQLLSEFKSYYELNDTKSEAIIAAITYPPVKTRFLMGLQDSVLRFNFQARNLLLKYGKDYHVFDDGQSDVNIQQNNQQNSMDNVNTATDFFDFGDGTEKVDAEELRDVNISKKELSELVAELYDGLMSEGLSMESIDLETPRKFLQNYQEERLNTPNTSPERLENNLDVSRQLDFENSQKFSKQNQEAETENIITTTNNIESEPISETPTESNIITSTNNQHDYSFQPDIMSTPSSHNKETHGIVEYNNVNSDNMALIPIAQTDNNMKNSHNKTVVIASSNLNTQLELIAIPIPGQPNCFQLARVIDTPENGLNTVPVAQITDKTDASKEGNTTKSLRYSKPYDVNYTSGYISVQRHIIAEYIEKFKSLQHAQDNKISSTTTDSMDAMPQNVNTGFTQYQYDLMQQQLRIHIQQLTQTFVQTYCHPELWKLAPKSKELLLDLQEKAKNNVNFQVWNLEPAVELIQNWQKELDVDTPENTELMNFLHHEIYATNHQSRQIPRFHPRILECYLNSPVFMYPQYLPRMPFAAKPSIPVFSPAEAYLIAMGLEKHLQLIYEKKEKISFKTTPLRVACKRLARDTVCGKRHRRIWQHIQHLKNVDYYNPIKYFFEHNRAPPVDHDPIWTFENYVVLPPKDRVPELPLVYQTYLQKKNEPPKPKPCENKKSRKKRPTVKVSEAFKNSFLEFVQEAVGQDLPTPNILYDPVESSDTPLSDADAHTTTLAEKRKKLSNNKPSAKRRLPQSLTINVNYVYGNGLDISATSNSSSLATLPAPSYTIECSGEQRNNNLSQSTENNTPTNISQNLLTSTEATETTITNHNTSNNSLPDSTINSTIDLTQNDINNTITNTNVPVITYNFDWRTKTLQPAFDTTIIQPQSEAQQSSSPPPLVPISSPLIASSPKQNKEISCNSKNPQKFNTNISSPPSAPISNSLISDTPKQNEEISSNLHKQHIFNKKIRTSKKVGGTFRLHKKIKQKASAYREKRHLQRRCEDLITTYSLHLDNILLKYKNHPLIQRYYRNFKSLELYTNLLKGLKLFCLKNCNVMAQSSNSNSPSTLKRTRNSNSNTEDDNSPSSARQVRKLNRQEENFRHMLLPDTPEEANRKDAIYAFNFYEKVEEAFKASNKPEDCKKFNAILKSFDPKKDKVSDLYYKLEKLFLPDHPELAQVFLTFLLPSEAAEIGKFFEHFMINNMTTFINKLNIYFNKQPAQIRKIYNCLNELAEDPNVTMKKVETKIIPLLKGNQFLIDWFMQQFPQNAPPERLFSNPEQINLKDQHSNRSGEHFETITDLMDSPINDGQQQQSCQLRYINGRIFYGSKMLLPAKLSFMAASYKNQTMPTEASASTSTNVSGCVHGIREHGEKRLQAAADLSSMHINTAEPPSSDDQDKSEEEDVSKALVIDTTADEEDSCSSVELCDEATLRAHATRLNPSVYSSTCYSSANATSTPNLINNFQVHHPNAKKTSLNFNEEAKLSPRKNYVSSTSSLQPHLTSPLANVVCNSPINSKEKRKSPNKKTKSPLNNSVSKTLRTNVAAPPMVVIHETNSAIQCAKRLKSLIDEEGHACENVEEVIDSKEIIQIVARTKNSLQSSDIKATASTPISEEVKEEDLEFLAEDTALSPSPFPSLRIETDSNEEDAYNTTPPPAAAPPPTNASSDEDCKIDIVSSLTTHSETTSSSATANEKPRTILPLNAAWTRDEDKVILIEMKIGSQNRQELYQRIAEKLPNRTMFEITSRHQFLMDFLSKLQGK